MGAVGGLSPLINFLGAQPLYRTYAMLDKLSALNYAFSEGERTNTLLSVADEY